ncbi:YciI family protein [Roseomonas elaeocarpi]|uniref:YciI family protein n=1 Tax=Roseomonas elaeocarpi TaxID=907779 RepID=A0ABV6JPZ1_9PROT
MLFAIQCQDKPNSLELRMSTRPAHLNWLESHQKDLVMVGPVLDDEGKPCGSLLIVEMPDQQTAETFAAADPYAYAGLFASSSVRPFRMVFRDGEQVA